jgi:hypothetical protein
LKWKNKMKDFDPTPKKEKDLNNFQFISLNACQVERYLGRRILHYMILILCTVSGFIWDIFLDKSVCVCV